VNILITCHVRFAGAMAWYALNTARGLRELGHEVYLSTQAGSPLSKWAQTEQLNGHHDFDYHTANPVHFVRALNHLRGIIREFKPDVLNPHCPPGHLLCALANCKDKIPLIRSVAEPRSPKANFVNKYLHEKRTRGLILSTGSSIPRYKSRFDLAQLQLRVILPGLDLARFPSVPREEWRAKLNVPETALFAAIIARMSPEKGQEVLLEALKLLPQEKRSRLCILMTGDDYPERSASELHALARSLGVENYVRFAPRCTDVRTLLQELDFGIITSVRSEAVCRIALEMMAYRLPIITSDVNILPEVISHGATGFVTPVKDSRALAEALDKVISDPAILKPLGEAGRRKLENEFTLIKQAEQTAEFYNSVIEGASLRS
jgi:glycosyltransferase involved in cell wall biosynthesis